MYAKYEQHFNKIYKKSKVRFRTFPHHVEIVRYWAEKLCDKHPEADRDTVIIAALFHDLGHFIGDPDELDHAIVSVKEAEKFLKKEGAPKELICKVTQAIRSHRNSDITPQSIEDKIIVFSDSASHLTSPDVYLYVAAGYGKLKALEKLERDYRDLALFPNEKKKLETLYVSWKNLIENFSEEFYPFIRDIEKTN